MSNALAVPMSEMIEFGRISSSAKKEVLTWLDILNTFDSADNKSAAIAELQVRYGHALSVSQPTIYRKLARYRADGWRGLAHRSRMAVARKLGLREAFVDFWHILCLENQRKIAPAYRSLFADHLLADRRIPGYGDWREIWRGEHPGWPLPERCPYRAYDSVPTGWSYENLLKYAPDVYQLTAVRIGTGAASQYLPSVPTTRVGLQIGQYYVMDDVFHDLKVNFVGNRAAQIPLELGALELLTGHYCVWGLKPVREREDGTREHLRETYMRYLLAHILCRIGIHPEGCTFLGEHGTATMDASLLAACNKWSGGRVKFEAGGIQGAPIAKGLYDGRPRGNSRFKAVLESHHNLKHNELAAMTGQRGKDRDHAPEDIYGRDKENNSLTKAIIALEETRPDLIEHLRRPYIPYHQFAEALALIYNRIAERQHHDLEGFEEAGLVVQEFRLAPGLPWMPMTEIDQYDAAQRAAVEAVISRPGMVKLRPMSPIEAWTSRSGMLTRLPDCSVPAILGPQLGAMVRVSDQKEIIVKDPEIPGKYYTYLGIAWDQREREIDLPRRSEWFVHVSPFDTTEAYISRLDGEFIGRARALQRACRDTAELQQSLGMQRRVLANELKALAPIADKRLRDRYEQTQHNARLLTGRDVVAEQAQAAEDKARRGGFRPDTLLDPADVESAFRAEEDGDFQPAGATRFDAVALL